MSEQADILRRGHDVLIQNYGRFPISMARGQGSRLWDADGREYLDLFAGFGGAILGHCHADLIAAATAQAGRLWHVGNTFYTEPQIEFADRLDRHAFAGKAFFCHSGLEANEAAIKLARLRGQQRDGKRWKMIALHKSFHGRSLATIAATGNAAVKSGFGPIVPGFSHVELGDFDALTAAIDPETAGIIVEPIQGEGGIHPLPLEYARNLRELCDDTGLTLIFDEVWTGCGRTGKWFGHQHLADAAGKVIEPDIMTLAKAVGGGLPVGVMFAKPEIAALLVPGKHGCTLGGNPICMAVARTIMDVIERDGLLARATGLGERAIARLRADRRLQPHVAEVRGTGLLLGIELKAPPVKIVERALDRGLVINLTSQTVIRLAPALTITDAQWNDGLNRLIDLIAES